MTESGKVAVVAVRNVGTSLVGDHAAGATSLRVYDRSEFSETGGTLSVGTETYTYLSWDGEAEDEALDLTAATTAAYEDGTPVLVLPVATEMVATVIVDDEGEGIEAAVPHDKRPLLAEGIRVDGEGETVEVEDTDEGWILVDVVKETPLINGDLIDPDTTVPTGALTDGKAPSSSPAATTMSGLRQVFVKWDDIVNEDLVTYEVHMSTNPMFVPVAGDAATLAATTPANLVAIHQLPNGQPLTYGVTDPGTGEFTPQLYYFRIFALDADGPASAPGVVAEGHMDQAAPGDIATGSVTAEKLDAILAIIGTLQIGSLIQIKPPGITITDGTVVLTGGITVADPTNPSDILVRLHPNGCFFKGRMETDILTVMQDLQINGTARLSSGGTFTLGGGVATPTLAPTVSQQPIQGAWPDTPSGYTERGIAWDSVDGCWIRLLKPTSGTVAGRCKVERVNTSGSVLGSVTLDSVDEENLNGICRLGAYYYSTAYDAQNDWWDAVVYSRSTGTFYAGYGLTTAPLVGRPTITTDGTSIFAFIPRTSTKLRISKAPAFTGSGGWSESASVEHTISALVSTNLTFAAIGSFDYGAVRLVIASGTSVRSFATTGAAPFTGLSEQAAEAWALESNAIEGGVAWDGAQFASSSSNSMLQKYSSYFPAAGEKWWLKYEDTGGGQHTAPSPVATIAVSARRYVTVTARPAPIGVTGWDLWAGYGATLPGTFYKRPETITTRAVTLTSNKSTSGSTTVPATNTMGGSPAQLADSVGHFWGGTGEFGFPFLRVPKWQTGSWYESQFWGAAGQSNATATLNLVYFIPLVIPDAVTIDEVGINVATGTAGAVANFALYADANGLPGARLVDWGNVSAATAGAKSKTALGYIAKPGFYWLAFLMTGAATAVTQAAGAMGAAQYAGAATIAEAASAGWHQTGQTSFPATASSLARSSTMARPQVRVKAA